MTNTSKHKMALLTWLIVYPMITILLALLEPLLSQFSMPMRTLVLSLIMVPAMVYGAMPFATARLQEWLSNHPNSKTNKRENTNV